MNVDFSKKFYEDHTNIFEFEYENEEYINDSYSNDLFNNMSSKIHSPNYICYETNEEFIENFLKIGSDTKENSNTHKLSDLSSQQYKQTTRESHNDSLSTFSSTKSQNNIVNNVSCENNIINEKFKGEKIMIENEFKMNNDIQSPVEKNTIGNFLVGNKKGRPMNDNNLIYDEITDKFYDPNIDFLEYKKARKRIQNRESAVRSRQKKRENFKHIEADMEYLKMENIRIKQENDFLKNEKIFLVDQIKFMQNLIKSNNLVLISNANLNVSPNIQGGNSLIISEVNKSTREELKNSDKKTFDIEKNISKNTTLLNTENKVFLQEIESNQEKNTNNRNIENKIYLNGKNQKRIGKVFSIFVICILSIIYISNTDSNSSDVIVFNSNSIMNLNEYVDNGNNTILSVINGNLLHLVIIIFIVLLYFPLYMIILRIIKFFLNIHLQNNPKIEKNL